MYCHPKQTFFARLPKSILVGKMSRVAEKERKTKETQIKVKIDLDKKGSKISTTNNFMDHMLELLARHADILLEVEANGDLKHHLIEDIAIVLGNVLEESLVDKVGIERYGSYYIPMDETLGFCALDLSGRPYFVLDLGFKGDMIEDCATEDLIHFFESLALNGRINLHLRTEYGRNDHHKAEAAFKAFAHALKMAISITSDELLSTKGKLA